VRLSEDLMDAMRVEHGALRVSKVQVDVVAVLAAPLTAAALPSRKSELHSLVADRFPECQVITRQAVAVGSETTHA